jgi:ferredoxin
VPADQRRTVSVSAEENDAICIRCDYCWRWCRAKISGNAHDCVGAIAVYDKPLAIVTALPAEPLNPDAPAGIDQHSFEVRPR